MTDSYKLLGQGVLAINAFTTIYTVPGATQAIIKNVRLINTGVVDGIVQIFRNGTGDAKAASPKLLIPAYHGSAEWDGTDAFATGDTVSASANVATMTYELSGDEIT